MTVEQFGAQLEGYFGGTYTAVQMREVKRWAEKRTARELDLVYRYCVLNETTQFKTPPDIKALGRNLAEVYEAYPETHAGSHNRKLAEQRALLTDEHGITEEELEENLARLREVVSGAADARRFRPAEDETAANGWPR